MTYDRIAELVSRVRNARFGDMVQHIEQLIESGMWRDFTTPVGTRFEFRACEFDYFLAVEEVDPTTVRYAYLKADGIDDLAAKQLRLADITGRGTKATAEERRSAGDVAGQYDGDPSGAGQRIRTWADRKDAVVTSLTSQAAKDPVRRKDMQQGRPAPKTPARRKRWGVEWTDDDTTRADAIVEKLQKDPDLARAVYKQLEAGRVRTRRDQKRWAGAHNPETNSRQAEG